MPTKHTDYFNLYMLLHFIGAGGIMIKHISPGFLLLLFSVSIHAGDCKPTLHRTTGTHYEPVTVHIYGVP